MVELEGWEKRKVVELSAQTITTFELPLLIFMKE